MRHAQAAQAVADAQHRQVPDQTRILGQTIVVIQILADAVYKVRDFQAGQASDLIVKLKTVTKPAAEEEQVALDLVLKMIVIKV
jgi:hypothetical protein